jgi:hypothetical protein
VFGTWRYLSSTFQIITIVYLSSWESPCEVCSSSNGKLFIIPYWPFEWSWAFGCAQEHLVVLTPFGAFGCAQEHLVVLTHRPFEWSGAFGCAHPFEAFGCVHPLPSIRLWSEHLVVLKSPLAVPQIFAKEINKQTHYVVHPTRIHPKLIIYLLPHLQTLSRHPTIVPLKFIWCSENHHSHHCHDVSTKGLLWTQHRSPDPITVCHKPLSFTHCQSSPICWPWSGSVTATAHFWIIDAIGLQRSG